METSVKVRYRGEDSDSHLHDAQVRWGNNDDPRGVLVPGAVYTLDHEELHTWHTKYYLTEVPGKRFNSVHFDHLES